MSRIPEITVHGRFQPPLHVNHWEYIRNGFELADRVQVLITNPFQDEAFEASASWRSEPENNPFTYEERCEMFASFFAAMGIDPDRYEFKAFNIKDPTAFDTLDPTVPNIVNVYSEWSAKKAETFKSHGLQVVRFDQAKSVPVSGTAIREIIKITQDRSMLPATLVEAGFMPQAVDGLVRVLASRK